ncbi:MULTISPECIES: hypothetical protein [Amycolatopsis]|nr:hypothetical protein [Amycolatopsis bullii]
MALLPDLPDIPDRIVKLVFNLDKGERVDRFCRACGEITNQVAVSFSDLPGLRENELERLAGRLLDVMPLIPVLGGKPTVCRCGAANR